MSGEAPGFNLRSPVAGSRSMDWSQEASYSGGSQNFAGPADFWPLCCERR